MASYTPNYNLKKPAASDWYSVDDQNGNMDAIDTALAGKVNSVAGKGLSTNDYTTTEKQKLSGIESGANKTTVDSSLSGTSTNPVQNKVVNTALAAKQGRAEVVSTTLLASGWVGASAPYTYDLGIASTYDFDVSPTNTLTAEQRDAMIAAGIVGNMSDNLLRAYEEKPTINLPVIVRKWVR